MVRVVYRYGYGAHVAKVRAVHDVGTQDLYQRVVEGLAGFEKVHVRECSTNVRYNQVDSILSVGSTDFSDDETVITYHTPPSPVRRELRSKPYDPRV